MKNIQTILLSVAILWSFWYTYYSNYQDDMFQWVSQADGKRHEWKIQDLRDDVTELEKLMGRMDRVEYEVYQKDIEKAIHIVLDSQFREYTFEWIWNGKPRFSTEFGIDGYKSILVDVNSRIIIKE